MAAQDISNPITIQTFPLEPVQNGQIRLPQPILETLSVNSDQSLVALQIGTVVVLAPHTPQVSTLASAFIARMEQQQISVETLLDGLQAERQAVWDEMPWDEKRE